jgi:uncharacterized protein (TIGR02271 family)
MSKTVVGLFNTTAQAEQVKEELIADGYESRHIAVHANDTNDADADYSDTRGNSTANDKDYTDIGSGGGTGIGEKISNFFRGLSGGDDEVHHHYATGVNEGGALLAVTVDDSEADEIAATLKRHGARDIEGDSRQDDFSTASGYDTTSRSLNQNDGATSDRSENRISNQNYDTTSNQNYDATSNRDYDRVSNQDENRTSNRNEEVSIPVVEEELVVGKREVGRGGVRVYSHVVEEPVDTEVNLRDERINVERRAVNRPATAADFASNSGSVIELNATGEEAVVSKTSRVVEEVRLGKESSEHTEAIHDTVRKTDVQVEQLTGQRSENDR